MAEFSVEAPFKGHAEYLTVRGIDELTRERLRIVSCGPTKLKENGFKFPEQWNPQSALLIPSCDITGQHTGYGARVFYQKSFGSEDSRAKYLSLPGDGKTPPNLHFSPLASWDKLEYGQRVFICESYIKANIACKLGFHAIGVSGVNGWSFRKELSPQLADIDWRGQGLKPVAFMDSNVRADRPDLWLSIKKLQAAMDSVCGVKLEVLLLPQEKEGSDWGLDDYYVEHGAQALRDLMTSDDVMLVAAELDAHLIQMNNEVCIIRDISKFADIERNIFLGRGQFEDVNYADRMAFATDADKPTPVAKVWTKWKYRNVVDTLKYKPGKGRIENDGVESYLNIWRGWGCDPTTSDCSLFTSWLEDAFTIPAERQYFVDWWAYQIQFPGTKLNSALMLVGPSGVGKGWMARIASRIFGHRNTWKCNLSDLESKFNSGIGASQICIIEEADVSGGLKVYNTLKDLITNEHIRYERKGIDAVQIDNCINIFMNSNHIDVFALDEFDRRFAVLEITNQSFANDPAYWDPRFNWVDYDGGAEAVFGYLLEYPISDVFNPKGEAPWSQAKSDMVEMTHDPIDTWVQEYVVKGESIHIGHSIVDGRLATAKELAWCMEEGRIPLGDVTRSMTMKMNSALKNARTLVANGGKKIKFLGVPSRYFLLKGTDYSVNWTEEVESRLFWRNLVASQQGEVANEESGLATKSKY